jgi:hypothetical protein
MNYAHVLKNLSMANATMEERSRKPVRATHKVTNSHLATTGIVPSSFNSTVGLNDRKTTSRRRKQ